MNGFQATVSALVYSILRARCGVSPTDRDFPPNRTVRFVLDQLGRMPSYLRPPFILATLAFDASSLPRHGKPFHRLPHEARWRHVEAWRNAPLGPCRDLVRFYESFAVLHWHAERHAARASVPALHVAPRAREVVG